MIRMALLSGVTALTLAQPALAQYAGSYGGNNYPAPSTYNQSYGYQSQDCERQRSSRQVTGGIVGAIAGGVLGAVISDNDDDDNRYRGRYDHRNDYRGRGYSSYNRGYSNYGHSRYDNRGSSNNDQATGAIVGALIGGVAGTALASSGSGCNTSTNSNYGSTQQYSSYSQPQPVYEAYDPYRNNSYSQPAYQQPSYQQPSYNQGYQREEELYGGQYGSSQVYSEPTYSYSQPSYSQPQSTYSTTTTSYGSGQSYSVSSGATCQTVNRPTTQSNGQISWRQVQVCPDAYGNY